MKRSKNVDEFDEKETALRGAERPVFFDIKVRAESLPLVMPPKDGVALKDRFRAAVLGGGG